jgi:hypothetical protein
MKNNSAFSVISREEIWQIGETIQFSIMYISLEKARLNKSIALGRNSKRK